MPFRVCFVCTGNICRSPMAESVFRARVAEAGLDGLVEVDSAGTGGWHEGDGADPRTVSVLEAGGYEGAHAARQFRADWFARLDLVIALDDRPSHGPAPPRPH
jgi:protein-tyrosine phosphatase